MKWNYCFNYSLNETGAQPGVASASQHQESAHPLPHVSGKYLSRESVLGVGSCCSILSSAYLGWCWCHIFCACIAVMETELLLEVPRVIWRFWFLHNHACLLVYTAHECRFCKALCPKRCRLKILSHTLPPYTSWSSDLLSPPRTGSLNFCLTLSLMMKATALQVALGRAQFSRRQQVCSQTCDVTGTS